MSSWHTWIQFNPVGITEQVPAAVQHSVVYYPALKGPTKGLNRVDAFVISLLKKQYDIEG